jgi:hypothetical protein
MRFVLSAEEVSPGHFADGDHLAPRLQGWLDRRPDVQLAVVSAEFALDFLRLPPERYRFVSGGSPLDHFPFFDGPDIGIAPLLPSDFKRALPGFPWLHS